MLDLDFNQFLDGNGLGRKSYNILRHRGIYKGDAFHSYIKELLDKVGVRVFGDLLSHNEDDLDNAKWRHRLKVFAADVSYRRLIKFPDDAVMYEIEPDKMEVALAVRCSMSIPFLFRPVEFNGSDRVNSLIVDGGIASNFPIDTFDSNEIPDHPTFGLLLEEKGWDTKREISHWPHDYFFAMFETMMQAHNKKVMQVNEFTHRTIKIPVGKQKTTEFNIPRDKKLLLYKAGYNAASDFLNHWSWPEYLAWAKRVRGIK